MTTTPDDPNPRALVEPLIGQRVQLTLTTGHTRTGTILDCGPTGLTLTSGIGGRMSIAYGDVDAIDACTCPAFDVSKFPGEVSTLKGLPDPGCPQHGRSA